MVGQQAILVVDDDKEMRGLLKEVLSSKNYSVVTAQNGKQAIEKLKRRLFDLVIVDLVMPEVNGFGVMEYIKQNCPQTPVVVTTGYVSLKSAIDAMRKGASDYLAKPFPLDMLEITVKRVLERRSLEQQLRLSESLATVGRLVASVVHEINNPLYGILNYIELLIEEEQEEEKVEVLKAMRSGLNYISSIVKQLLSLSRAEPVFEPVDVRPVIDAALELVAYKLSAQGIKVEKRYAAKLPQIRADANQLQQVFINLAMNALQAMPAGGKIGIAASDKAGSLKILFADSGYGIPQRHLPHIFDPFFTTQKLGMGVGLGLWISQQIVKGHGGNITAESKEGQGTTFTIELPIGA